MEKIHICLTANSFISWCFFFQIKYCATELRVNRWCQALIHTSHITYVFLCDGAFCRFGLHVPFGSLLCLVQSRAAIHLMIWQHENNNKNTQTRWDTAERLSRTRTRQQNAERSSSWNASCGFAALSNQKRFSSPANWGDVIRMMAMRLAPLIALRKQTQFIWHNILLKPVKQVRLLVKGTVVRKTYFSKSGQDTTRTKRPAEISSL